MQKSLSIVLLAGDPSRPLGPTVAELLAIAAQHRADFELILAVDGGDAATRELAARLAAAHGPVLSLQIVPRRGFRYALRYAWGVARGEQILAVDAAQVPTGELRKLLALADDHGAVFAARSGWALAPALARVWPPLSRGTILRDPALRLFLASADLAHAVAATGPDATVTAELEAGARRGDLAVAQVDVAARREAGGERERATIGLGVLVVAGCLWLVRRWLPGGERG